MRVLLISTYDLGHQPFGLSSPAAWLSRRGHAVACLDLAVERLDIAAVAEAELIAFHVPMHTATRIAAGLAPRIRQMNPRAHLCFYGLYAPLNADYLRGLGAQTILGGEYEQGLADLADRLSAGGAPDSAGGPLIVLERQHFEMPDRSGLPPLNQYAYVQDGPFRRVAGYTEATRGCKHLCRHCPVVPVYNGRFFVVQRDVVMEDIRAQVRAGAQHITFGDPDFFNGPGHATAVVRELHREFPHLTYDATIKIEHLLRHARYLPLLKETGCLFITSAVESIDARTLDILQKQHTREDFVQALALCRRHDLVLNPTFVTFSPWTTLQGYVDLLSLVIDLDLIENIAPIQYAIRLLIPRGSRLLELQEICDLVGAFDEQRLAYPWTHPDPRVDQLFQAVRECIEANQQRGASRPQIFAQIWDLVCAAAGPQPHPGPSPTHGFTLKTIPHLSEPWYCCAEPTEEQLIPF